MFSYRHEKSEDVGGWGKPKVGSKVYAGSFWAETADQQQQPMDMDQFKRYIDKSSTLSQSKLTRREASRLFP